MTVAASGAVATAIDLRTRRVPNPATAAIASVGFALAAMQVSGVTLVGALAGFVIGFVLMLPGHLIGGTGAGDVKLLAALGTLLGPAAVMSAFVYTAIAGGMIAVAVAVRRRRLGRTVDRIATLVGTGGRNLADIEASSADNRFAYAPAIAIGALVAALGR